MRTALVERARDGDEDAFTQLVDLDGNRCFAIAYRILRHVERAKDAVQQAFLLAWRELPRLRNPERHDCGGTVHWLALGGHRRAARDPDFDPYRAVSPLQRPWSFSSMAPGHCAPAPLIHAAPPPRRLLPAIKIEQIRDSDSHTC
jgi:hypothetical protein